MGQISKFILIFQVLVLLIGSVGINVFSHTCEQDGTMTSYFLNLENHCSEGKVELPSCCQKTHDDEHSPRIKKDCCSDAHSYLQYQPLVDFQTEEPIKKSISEVIEPIIPLSFSFFPSNVASCNSKLVKPPPEPSKKHGISLLIQYQILRL